MEDADEGNDFYLTQRVAGDGREVRVLFADFPQETLCQQSINQDNNGNYINIGQYQVRYCVILVKSFYYLKSAK